MVGGGPCGLAATDQLLGNGVPPGEIAVVSPSVPEPSGATSWRSPTVRSAYLSSLAGGALTKAINGRAVSLHAAALDGPISAHWGASCLPLPSTYPLAADSGFREAYRATVGRWHVSSEQDGLSELYPLTGETIGDLPRKELAGRILATSLSRAAGHSRLALRGESFGDRGCSGRGLCFHGCPNDSPWSAAEELRTLVTRHPGLQIVDQPVHELDLHNDRRVGVRAGGAELSADRVVVAAGWRATSTLLGGRPPRLDARAELEQSTVVISTLLLKASASQEDFYQHLTYHDLVLPHLDDRGHLAALTQVYLPTHELAGRILASLPLSKLVAPAMSTILTTERGSAALGRAMRHVGVAMTFFPGSSDWTSASNELSLWKEVAPRDLRMLLGGVGGRVVSAKKVVLSGGQSQHIGVWAPYRYVIPRLIAGDPDYLRGALRHPRVVAADPCLLPVLPPGPHTASAAACGRLLVDALVRDWS